MWRQLHTKDVRPALLLPEEKKADCQRQRYISRSRLKTTVILGEVVVGDHSSGTRGQRAGDREGEGGGGRWG